MLYKLLVVSIVICSMVVADNDSNYGQARFEKLNKKFVGKSKLDGVYKKEKYEEPTTFKVEKDDRLETKEKIKGKINFREVDVDGNEYETEIDAEEIDKIIARGLLMLNEGSKGENANEKDNEKRNDEDKRNLIVLGSDTRYEITSATWSPVKQTGLLTFSGGYCSAALIGPRTLLTAGHCVHSGDGGSWYSNFRFYPGRTSTSTSVTGASYTWSGAMSFNGWTQDGDYDWDIALVQLSSSPNIGWVSMGYDGGINDDWYFYSKGYPSDKSPYGSMWATSDYISDANTNTLETDDSDTYDGHSGAPWYAYPSYLTYPRIFAAHSGSGWWFGYYNRHTRITST